MDSIDISPRRAEAAQVPLAQSVLNTLPPWARGRRGLIIAAIALAIGGLAAGWNWVVALGVAPLILSLAPCAIMCALGVCMMGKGGQSSCAKEGSASDAAKTVAKSDDTAAPLATAERGSVGGA